MAHPLAAELALTEKLLQASAGMLQEHHWLLPECISALNNGSFLAGPFLKVV